VKPKWIRYRVRLRGGLPSWSWEVVPAGSDAAVKNFVEEFVEGVADQYAHAESVRVQYELFDDAPLWVVEQKYRENNEALRSAQLTHASRREDLEYLHDRAKPCTQCHRQVASDDYRAPECPSCGRRVEALPYLLRPDQQVELALLRGLVEAPRKSKSWGNKLVKKTEEEAYQALVDLGLAGGSHSSSESTVYATEKGKAELAKHVEVP
jgi:hypothetical protein